MGVIERADQWNRNLKDVIAGLSITPQGMVSELKRELQMRRRVYSRWVDQGKLARSDADFRIKALEAVLAIVEAVYAEELGPPQSTLFAG